MINFLRPIYHATLVALGTIFYRFPSKKLVVIGVTGTKGKSTTSEMLAHILETSGKKVFLSSTIHFKIAGREITNLLKMTMPGRFLLQKMLRQAVDEGCTHAVVEMSSEGAKLWRHVGIELNGLIVTNLSPEHIESHGSFDKYRAAKLRFLSALNKSSKPNKFLVLNTQDQALNIFTEQVNKSVSVKDLNHSYITPLPGQFNKENAEAAGTAAENLGLDKNIIQQALNNFTGAKGRVEKINLNQPFEVVVDYAHTADSLEKFYQIFEGKRKICVFGATGGGRDKWKRPEMGKVADKYCDEIILTDDDSYDESPQTICEEIATGITAHTPQIITDRREAIKTALALARPGDAVLITGKGTDPFLMGPKGKKTPWSDTNVTKEELTKLLNH
jgi:UDP-N-acetylmuramoyl-L-alanyl-D-glutamate--2,6-diaminopimelate ligase